VSASVNSSGASNHERLGETGGQSAFAVVGLLVQTKQTKQTGLLYSPQQCEKQETATSSRERIFGL